MRVTSDMVNGHGMCHGGFIFALADSAFAFACNTRNERAVASNCQIAFLRPASLGTRLVAEARERTRAGRSGIYDITVRDGERVVAEFRGHSRDTGSRFFEDVP
jgi:acyl-CoA thioesterase